jgi:hypothetical protein
MNQISGTDITLGFNEAVDGGSVSNAALYSILGSVKKHGKTTYNKRVAIKQVTYNPSANTVTITLSKPYKGKAQLNVSGLITAAGGPSNNTSFSTIIE